MVEFALAIPIFLMMTMGIVEGGRLLFIYAGVLTASREAARYGVVVGDNETSIMRFRDCAGMRAAAQRIGFFTGINEADIKISYSITDYKGVHSTVTCTYPTTSISDTVFPHKGDRITVEVKALYEPILLPFVNFSGFWITSQDTRTVLMDVYIE